MKFMKECCMFCADYGYCANRGGKYCNGFVPMDDDDEEYIDDDDEQRIERTTY